MRPALREDIKVEGNLDGERITMGFDQNSLVHIMSVLTDLYSDPEKAVIREISTNAWDSHIAAGQTRPIEVTTPTNLSFFFKVKDYGVGLDEQDIKTVFSLYGASTKRDSDTQTGTLGLGCKSPLTYSNSFTVTGVKDGVKTQVSVSRETDGSGVMEIVDTSETDEPNGVEIIIPAKQYNSFKTRCLEFFQYWPAGSVLLDGQAPPRFIGKEICNNIFMTDGGDNVIVMGNVPYPIGYSKLGYKNYSIAAFVEMGAVNFTPSREELQYTPHTNRTLENIVNDFETALRDTIKDEIKNADSHADAMNKYYEWCDLGANHFTITEFEYDGEKLPGRFDSTGVTMWYPANYRNTISRPQFVDWKTFERSMVVVNFKLDEFKSQHKTKLRKYANANSINSQYFMLCDEMIGSPWTDQLPVVDWEDVNAFKLPRKPRDPNIVKGPKEPDNYEVLQGKSYNNTERVEVKDIDDTKEIYYFSKQEHDPEKVYPLTQLFKDATILVLGKNRWAKMLRNFPHAVHIDDKFKEFCTTSLDNMTFEDKVCIAYSNYKHTYTKFKNKTFDDPELHEFVQASNGMKDSDIIVKYRLADSVRYYMSYYDRLPVPDVDNPIDKYPLFSTYHVDETVFYCNAKYAKEQLDG